MCPGLSSSYRETPTLAKGGLPLRGRRRRQDNLIRASVLSRTKRRFPPPSAGGRAIGEHLKLVLSVLDRQQER